MPLKQHHVWVLDALPPETVTLAPLPVLQSSAQYLEHKKSSMHVFWIKIL